MAVGDIYEFTLRQRLLGQDVLNVFHYDVVADLGGGVTGNDLAYWVWNQLDLQIKAIQSDSLTYVQMDCLQITGGVTIGSYVIGEAGTETGTPVNPAFFAWGFRYNRASAASRHGYKRFAGVGEGYVDEGLPTAPAITAATSLADQLIGNVLDPDASESGELRPVILSRVLNGVPRVTPVAFPIASIVFTGFTTQTTRKR